ncbi:ImpA domain-containing protein [Caballeronia novacaledonica]|uniref:ImpA domain-containing protein n=1 Tax=Caballeronia novacaledonica TaxID=1544861 RepID=A0A2U3I4T3_9BURK|nr:type VI secretion system ImpA family N-terminal domain-containing protein [Caballeronia novacaledonica]SPB15124.1 ImpA domain-containing protein [Caballeronia novacaledonica]
MTSQTVDKRHAGKQKRHSADAVKPEGAPREWITPVTAAEPCGPDLEYDHDFVVLFASTVAKQDVQYGAFVGAADPINWGEVDRDCRRLLSRTKDIRVAVLHVRCRTRLAGATGLAEGMGLLAAWLRTYPRQVHPREGAEYGRGEAQEMRMNALLELVDPEGLMADVREIALGKSTVARLRMRDVERAFAFPRPADALAPDSVVQQLRDLRMQQSATMTAFEETLAHLEMIDAWCGEQLGDNRPDLAPLVRLLELLRPSASDEAEAVTHDEPLAAEALTEKVEPGMQDEEVQTSLSRADEVETQSTELPAEGSTSSARLGLHAAPNDRQSALASIRAARLWFEVHEPSSPIPVLLKRAEAFVGKRYSDVVKAIPAELLAEWDI